MKQSSVPYEDLSSLYSTLDEQTDEIRVITINPLKRRGLLQCRLEKVALKDFTPDLVAFIGSLGQNGRLTRRITSR